MRRIVLFIFLFLSAVALLASKKQFPVKRQSESSTVILSNKFVCLSVLLQGGAFVDFRLIGQSVNPFSWKVTKEQMPVNNRSGAVFQGHFLCTGRWGAPTAGEIKVGVPHNGQSARDKWTIVEKTDSSAIMQIKSPLDGIEITRKIQLITGINGFRVTETFRNYTSIGRLFNIVQHATLGTPFLEESTRVNSNARQGFLQSMCFPDPYRHEFMWPAAYSDSLHTALDLTRSDTKDSYVSTHIFTDSIGWIKASSPSGGLSIAYLWKTREYPWLNLWQQRIDGKLWAKGLEFGTCGIGKPYQELLQTDTRFYGRNSFFFLDAGEKIEKSWCCFLERLPERNSEVTIDAAKLNRIAEILGQ